MTRTAAKHAAPARRSVGEHRSARKLEVAGVSVGLLGGFALALALLTPSGAAHSPESSASATSAASAQAAPRTAPSPSGVRVAADPEPNPTVLDEEWETYSDHSTCADWAGGDGISAIALNTTQVAWFFSDTFLGPASQTTGFSHLSGFVNNDVVVQTVKDQSSTFVTMTGGGACSAPGNPSGTPKSVVRPPRAPGAAKDRYWDADGIKIGGTVVRFYNRFLPGGVPFIPTGTVMATFSASQLSSVGNGSAYGQIARPGVQSLPSYTPSSGGTPIIWGAAVARVGGTVYIYGTQTPDPSAPERQLYLARVPASQLTTFSAWRFYAGSGQWSAGQSSAEPVQPSGSGVSVSSGFSVVDISGRYWLIQADPQPGTQDIDAYPAADPWGPFSSSGLTLYTNDDIGLDATHDYRIMYEARAELALSTSNTLVISYNVNSEAVTAGACVPLSSYTNTVVQPKFIAIPMSDFTGARDQVTIGPSDYPSIVQRDPGQWVDAWNYPGGCPPVPSLTSVQARPKSHAVKLTWPDDGLGMRYRVYLTGPGETGKTPVTSTSADTATITGLRPGSYHVTVTPINIRQNTGTSATASFAVP